jgi:tripartite ATP-independent transporter DctP family solute receptor
MKKTASLALCLFMGVLSAFGSGSTEGAIEGKVELKLGHALSPSAPAEIGSQFFGNRVKEAASGRITVITYPSNQLGDNNSLMEQVAAGNLDLTVQGAPMFGTWYKPAMMMEMPYMIDSYEHLHRAMEGKPGQMIKEGVRQYGFEALAYWDRTSRHVLTTKRIDSIDDLKGIKLRVPELDVPTIIWRNLGVNPTPISTGEIYAAMQQGVVQGAEQPLSTFYELKHYEVCKFLALTDHAKSVYVLIMSLKTLGKFNAADRAIIEDAAKESQEFYNEQARTEEKPYREVMEKAGVVFTNPDLVPFRKIALDTHPQLADKYGREFYDEVRKLADK